MSILKILQYPDLRLRRKGYQVTDIKSEKIQKVITSMITTLENTKNCAGLASTQLDIADPPNIIVINLPKDDNSVEVLCLINPQIISKEGSSYDKEGCMSIYPKKISAKIKRAEKIKVEAFDHHDNKLGFEATGFFARCIQHECDHLNGILYIDHVPKSKRSHIDKKIATLNA